jgi:hypothetical protein
MERSYLNTVIGFVAILLFGIFVMIKPESPADYDKKIQEIFTVNMPRPIKEFFASFSLDDRNVIRIVENPEDSNKKESKKLGFKTETQAAVDKKKTEVEKKRQEYRRQQYLQKQAQERAFRIRVVQESERYRRELLKQELDKISNLENSLEDAYNYAAQRRVFNNNTNNNQNNEATDKEVLTADQWKSLILSQPTRENAFKLVEAYQNNEIDMASYNEISELLINDNSEEKKKLGVWILTAATSLESFKLAVKLMPSLDTENQKILNDYVYSYSRPQTLPILEQILKSTDASLKTLAADVISKGFEQIRPNNQVVTNSNRGNRNNTSPDSSSISNFRRLVPTLQWLISNPTSGLSQWAQGLLSQLQSSTTPA